MTDDQNEPRFEWHDVDDMLQGNPVPPGRLATGLPALDAALGGGVPLGTLVTLQGSPGAGKTSLAIQFAVRQHQGGAADVYLYLPDEGWRGGCTRVAQNLGLSRELIARWPGAYGVDDTPEQQAMVALGGALRATPAKIRVCDPDHDLSTLETVLEQARVYSVGSDRAAIIIVDSTQTARAEEADGVDSLRERIGAVMQLLKKATRRWDCVILNISHINRSAYKHKRQEDNTDPLAAGAESGTIERQSDVMVHLTGDIQAIVTARVIKNRVGMGAKPEWQMRFDAHRAQFAELDYAEAQDAERRAEDQKKQLELERLRDDAVAVVRKKGGWTSQAFVAGRLPKRKAAVVEALNLAVNCGDLDVTEGPKGSVLYRAPAPALTGTEEKG